MPEVVERCERHDRVTRWRTSVLDKKRNAVVPIGPVHESPCPDCAAERKAQPGRKGAR